MKKPKAEEKKTIETLASTSNEKSSELTQHYKQSSALRNDAMVEDAIHENALLAQNVHSLGVSVESLTTMQKIENALFSPEAMNAFGGSREQSLIYQQHEDAMRLATQNELIGKVSAISDLDADRLANAAFGDANMREMVLAAKETTPNLAAYALNAEEGWIKQRQALEEISTSNDYFDALSQVRDWSPPAPKPPPTGGKEITTILVHDDGGTVNQIGEVLNSDFDMYHYPLCYLVQNEDDPYWHIKVFHGTEEEARNVVEKYEDSDSYENLKALISLLDRTKDIGYVHVSDRPIILVRFCLYPGEESDLILNLVATIKKQLIRWNFKLINNEESNQIGFLESLPDGAEALEVSPILLFQTVDGLQTKIKSYLQAIGKISESMGVKQKSNKDGIFIYYNFAGNLIVISIDTLKLGQIKVELKALCWENQEVLKSGHEHITDMIHTIKENIRWSPVEPPNTDDIYEWFDYYHQCQNAGVKFTLKDIAKKVYRDYGYVRQLHSSYKIDRGI